MLDQYSCSTTRLGSHPITLGTGWARTKRSTLIGGLRSPPGPQYRSINKSEANRTPAYDFEDQYTTIIQRSFV
jgi:hypothetical protein